MASKRTTRRQNRRRRRRMKPSFKKGLAIFIAVALIGGYAGFIVYRNAHSGDIYGGIKSEDLQEDDSFTVTSGAVSYTVFNLGSGEAILIRCGGTEALIDMGTEKKAKKLCKELKDRVRGDLDYLVLTGPDDKRLGGAEMILSEFTVGTCVVGEMGDKASSVNSIVSSAGTKVDGDNLAYDIGDNATLFIVKPEVSSDDPNDRSLITYFTFGNTGFVTLSDAGKEEISRAFGNIGSCNLIVLAQHGSAVNKAIPGSNYNYCIATAGKDSGLPDPEVTDAIRATYYTTGATGTLEFVSDGSDITLSNEEDVENALNKEEKSDESQ